MALISLWIAGLLIKNVSSNLLKFVVKFGVFQALPLKKEPEFGQI